MNLLDLLFARFRWYRRAMGGTWTHIAFWPQLPASDPFWIRGEPRIAEKVFEREVWPK